MNLLVKDAVALLLAAFGLIATTRWLLMRCYSPPQPATLARLAHAVHSAGRQQRKRDVAETATLLNATAHLRMPVGVWHALAPSGRCPAPIPTWDWQLLLAAARAERSHERYQAMERLRASSSLAYGELVQLVHRYRAKLRDPEFAHILDPSHARCGGRRPKRGQSGALVVPQLLCPGLLRLALQGPGCATASNGRLRCCCAARSKPPIPWATTPTPHHHPAASRASTLGACCGWSARRASARASRSTRSSSGTQRRLTLTLALTLTLTLTLTRHEWSGPVHVDAETVLALPCLISRGEGVARSRRRA